MRELSLFSGAGGGLLATKYLLGWSTIGYVEFEDYPQRVIAQRIADGLLDNAPIFGDIRAFIDSGCAELYRGITDVITAGFPCQPFSAAGKQLGADDERNMWPSTIECIRQIRPRYAFLENVPAILTSGYFGTVTGDLAEAGYDCRWATLSTGETGGCHERKRLWIVATDASSQPTEKPQRTMVPQGHWESRTEGRQSRLGQTPNTNKVGIQGQQQEAIPRQRRKSGKGVGHLEDWARLSGIRKPLVSGVDDALAHRVDRTKAVGNGQDPFVAAKAWELLS